MTTNEEKLFKVIEHLTVSLINTHLSEKGLHLEKHKFSEHGYDFVNEKGEIMSVSNDSKMEIKGLFEDEIYKDEIGLGFHPDENYLLLGFNKLKETLDK